MTEYTDEQIAELIKKAREESAVLEQYTIAEDTLRRSLRALTAQQVASGLWHPFLKEVAETMYSDAIKGRNFTQPQEQKDEVPEQD
jgi:rhamnogalacturonyl hydrolase YesR